MLPNFDDERNRIVNSRRNRERIESRLVENQNRVRALENERDTLARSGASENRINEVIANLENVRRERHGLINDIRVIDDTIADIIGGVIVNVQPERMFAGLDGRVPVAMLPARIETRFFNRNRQLRIRIFPDQVHIDGHTPELLAQEIELGKQYWQIRRDGDGAKLQAAWEELARTLSPTRAAWIVQTMTPESLDAEPLVFPEPPQRTSDDGRTPRATLLPDRWVAVGLERVGLSGYREVFRKWGSAVPDTLNVSLSFEETTEDDTDDDDMPLDPALRWTVDYDEAVRVGMAITVDDGDLDGHRLAQGVDLLLVMGIDWTLSPDQGAESMARLLHAHQYSDGMAFVPQATPTNNTGASRSGLNTNPLALAAEMDPAHPPVADAEDSAAARMRTGLGLPDDSPALYTVTHADLREQHTTSLMVDALWQSTLGYYLDHFLDPLVDDDFIDLARDHAVKYLQPFGPFTAFRVGKQPYGLVPVMAPEHFKPDREQGTESMLERILRVVQWYWTMALENVPRMGGSNNPDDDLLNLLQRNPLSQTKRFRKAVDAETAANTQGMENYAQIQAHILRSFVLPQFASFAGPFFDAGKIGEMVTAPRSYPLYGPWVQSGVLEEGAALDPNYIVSIAQQTRRGRTGRRALNNHSSSNILLEALLAYAALRELIDAESRVLNGWLVDSNLVAERPVKSSLNVRTMLGIHTPQEIVDGEVYVQTPEQQSNLVIPRLTGRQSLADFVARELLLRGQERPELRNLNTFLADMDALAQRPVAEIDRAMRGVLDCYSYRLDAWYTSLASRRLDTIRRSRPVGLHIGGYGWVENLRPERRPDSLGYIHAPSMAHAATAAIMRSGHLSHRGQADAAVPEGSQQSALNIDLSSERVRVALNILEGVAQGQPLAALLGYRFERGLRDRDINLAQYILPIRKLAPYRSTAPDDSSEPDESIAARDVVDGVKLLDQWRSNRNAFLNKIKDPTPSAGQRSQINEELSRLDNMLDAISDVLVSEAVYQTVQGNFERAGAALAALDRQARPPDPQVIRTPRSGDMYQQRVLVLVQATTTGAGWTVDPRAQAEPRLNTWIASLIGDPARYVLAGQVIRGEVEDGTVTATLAELGLSPLSLALTSVATSARMPSELELRLAQVLVAKVPDPDNETALELVDDAPGDAVGFGALRALLQMMNAAVAKQTSASARDLALPEENAQPGMDLTELQGRVTAASTVLDNVISALEAAVQINTLRDALFAAAAVGARDALPEVMATDEDAAVILMEQAARVREDLVRTRDRLLSLQADFEAPPESDEEHNSTVADHLVAQLRVIFGEAFPVLPVFMPVNSAELSASRAERDTLLSGDPFAPLTWMQQMATVRPQIDKFASVLTAAEMLGTEMSPGDFNVIQLPHVAGQRWAALAQPESEPALALMVIGTVDLDQPLAGFAVDGWSEVIPAATELTGMAFHYDAPASRPPQAIILAVPPQLNQRAWSFEAIFDTVMHTLELAKMRAVGPQEIPALGGGMLPMIYLPEDKTRQLPSINLMEIANAHIPAVKVIGKMMTDA